MINQGRCEEPVCLSQVLANSEVQMQSPWCGRGKVPEAGKNLAGVHPQPSSARLESVYWFWVASLLDDPECRPEELTVILCLPDKNSPVPKDCGQLRAV